MTERPFPAPSMDSPAQYRIRVRGEFPARDVDRLGGLQIADDPEPGITRLEGTLSDQAALSGALTLLYELQLPVISLECLAAGTDADSQSERSDR